MPGACVSAEAESFRSLGVTVFEEVEAAGVLVVLPDIARSLRENGDAAEESSVGLMAVRDRPGEADRARGDIRYEHRRTR